MGQIIDLSGLRYGKLVVMSIAGKDKYRNTMFLCKCDCGNYKIINGCSLRKGLTKSCGCIQKEIVSKMFTIHGQTKGYHRERLHSIWHGMKNRCLNPKTPFFKNYGGRGISICDDWLNNFDRFYKWALENGYKENLTIDRIDNDKGYYPLNCRWATYKQQRANQRKS